MDSSIRIERQMEIPRLPEPVWRSLLALLLLLTAFLAGSRAWAADSKVKFDLPAEEFPKEILEFYHQSKIEVLFLATDALRKIRTHRVVGELEPRTALTLML